MKRPNMHVGIALSACLMLNGAYICAENEASAPARETDDAENAKFFWCKEGVPVEVVRQLLCLMNKCLEQKVANDTFVELLVKMLDQLKKITMDIDEKTRLEKNIQYLLNTIKAQAKQETRELKTLMKAVSTL